MAYRVQRCENLWQRYCHDFSGTDVIIKSGFTVGNQIAEVLCLHMGMSRKQARQRVLELLKEVGIPSPETKIDAYPNQLSGGQQQRVMIAMAIACEPKLLIADEPTTALDVTIQKQIIDLLESLRQRRQMSMLLLLTIWLWLVKLQIK